MVQENFLCQPPRAGAVRNAFDKRTAVAKPPTHKTPLETNLSRVPFLPRCWPFYLIKDTAEHFCERHNAVSSSTNLVGESALPPVHHEDEGGPVGNHGGYRLRVLAAAQRPRLRCRTGYTSVNEPLQGGRRGGACIRTCVSRPRLRV